MPSKNVIKIYVRGGYYHIYNRGVEKKKIFKNHKDYVVFLHFLKEYLLPLKHIDLMKLQWINPRRHPINCNNDIELLAYCLMPNHFHLLVKQKTQYGLKKFMKALSTNYVMYFNKKYDRVGPLFQGTYKAVLVEKEIYFLHLSRYIHSNPSEIARDQPLQDYAYSSYKFYLSGNSPEWLNTEEITLFFKSGTNENLSYKSFVESYTNLDKKILEGLSLD